MTLHPSIRPRRYLVGFDPRELPHHFTDVLVIGGGIAGLRAALGIPERYRVLVVTKDEVRESNSQYAQGGIAGVLDPEDRFDNHIADTLAAGKGLCDPEVVEMVVREAPVADRRADRLGHALRRGRRPRRAGPRGGPLARADRPRARRRDRPRDHARRDPQGPRPAQHPALGQQLHDRPADPRRTVPGRAGLGPSPRTVAGVGPGRRCWPPGAPASSSARRPTRRSPPPTAMPWPIAPAPSCATWSSCSSTRPCCTSPARRDTS